MPVNPNDYVVPYGGAGGVVMYTPDRLAAAKAAKAERDAQFEANFGYSRQFQGQNAAAASAAEAEYRRMLDELQGGMQDIQGGELARSVQDYYSRLASGEIQPYDTGAMNALVAGVTDQITRASQDAMQQMRMQMAARGLGASGWMADAEGRYATQGAVEAALQGQQMRANLMGQNFGARERGIGGLSSYYGTQQGLLNSLRQQMAQLRSQKEYTPSSYLKGGPAPAGGYVPTYKPPQSTGGVGGGSAPNYSTVMQRSA